MKTIVFLLFCCALLASTATAQHRGKGKSKGYSASSQPVDAGAVPAAVTAAYEANFSRQAVQQWRQNQVNAKTAYTAHFETDGKKTCARFGADGTYRWLSVHHTAAQVPAALSEAAVAANPGFEIQWAKQIYNAKKQFTYYKVRMRKAGSVLTSYFDQNLAPLTGEKVKKTSPDTENDIDDEG